MAFFDSQSSDFIIDNAGGTPQIISPFVTEVSGLPGPRNLNDVTALGDAGRKSIPGLEDVTISLSGILDTGVAPGVDEVIGALRTATAAVRFEYWPEGEDAGDAYYGSCWVENYEVTSRVGSHITWSATLRVEGTTSRGSPPA